LPQLNGYLANVTNNNESDVLEKEILKLIAHRYKITYDVLINSKSEHYIVKAKKIAYCVLHIFFGKSSRHIANKVFKLKYHNSVAEAIKRYKNANPKIKADKEFKQEVDLIIESINNKVNSSK
jgi:chromosomal replication initiation ATPase DnaA